MSAADDYPQTARWLRGESIPQSDAIAELRGMMTEVDRLRAEVERLNVGAAADMAGTDYLRQRDGYTACGTEQPA